VVVVVVVVVVIVVVVVVVVMAVVVRLGSTTLTVCNDVDGRGVMLCALAHAKVFGVHQPA